MIYKKLLLSIFFVCLLASAFAQERSLHHVYFNHYGNAHQYRSEIHIPDILGYKTLKCDFHTHTIFSDGSVTPQIRVEEAWSEGLDVLALTDHDTPFRSYIKADYNTAYDEAVSSAKRLDILLIKGLEYTRNKPVGHINLLFLDDANPYADEKLSPEEVIRLANRSGAYVIYNHPGWPDKNSDLFDFQKRLMNEGQMHGIELFNSTEFYPIAMQYIKDYPIAPISATDIHPPVGTEYGYGKYHRNMTFVFADERTEEALKEAMFERRTVAYAQNMLAGDSRYILELFKASLEVSAYKEDGLSFSCRVKNNSDIDYFLMNDAGNSLVFPAHKTVLLDKSLQEMLDIYRVTNTYTGVNEHLPVTFNLLRMEANECMMPLITQPLNMVDKQTEIAILSQTEAADIYYTLDGSEPSESSIKYEKPFRVDNSGIIRARAYRQGMTPSRIYQKQVMLSHLHKAVKAAPKNKGLEYTYYEGEFRNVSEIDRKGTFIQQGICEKPDISMAGKEDHYGFIYKGYVYIPAAGVYRFATYSDDGSVLYIDGIEVVNNDGSHSVTKVSQEMALEKGYHRFELKYLEDYEEQELKVLWTVPGKGEEEIPPANYYY